MTATKDSVPRQRNRPSRSNASSSDAAAPRSRYLILPLAAFREGDDLEFTQLPVRVQTRTWERVAWLFFVLAGFCLFGVVMIHLENTYWPEPGERDLHRLPYLLWFLVVLFAASGIAAWRRVDEVELRVDRVRVQRRGLFGTLTHEARMVDYSGVRAHHRYVEDYEVTSGTTYWDVTLVHPDPALEVVVFAKSRDEPADHHAGPPRGDRTDWTDRMNAVADEWSRDLGLRRLAPPRTPA
jgi:hypothetical protein